MKSSAKELFLSFLGSKYQMMREGVIERYLSYNVSKEEEMTWIEELFQSLYIRLQRNINDLNTLHQITYLIECHGMVEHAITNNYGKKPDTRNTYTGKSKDGMLQSFSLRGR